MARTIAPLLSFDAGGQIAKTQVYAKWKGRSYVRRYAIPSNPKTTAQTETRSVFAWLNQTWKYYPGSATSAWQLYADNLRITDRNAFIKQNLSTLRTQSDLDNLTISPAANGGIAASGMVATPSTTSISVALAEPSLPTGWTITAAFAAAVKDQDPHSGVDYEVFASTDVSTPFVVDITGLTTATLYQVAGWFQFAKPDGSAAYGVNLRDQVTTS